MNTIRTFAAAGAVAAALVGGTLLVAANADDVAADPGVVGSLSATTDQVVVVTEPQSVDTSALDVPTDDQGAGQVVEPYDDDHDDDHDEHDEADDRDDHDEGEEHEFEGHDDDD
jgi:hypothetical protein